MKLPKLITILSFFLFFSLFFTASTQATELNTQEDYEAKVQDTQSFGLEDHATHVLNSNLQGLNFAIKGGGGPNSPTGYAPGAIQIAGNYVSYLITQPPSSSVDYIADLSSKIGLAKPAYAQEDSTGYQGLKGILEVWKVFRNIAYAFFVIIFVVVGFMIMFRARLNPQTVVSLQMALPKLIITLILITFSYAIAGLVLDLMYLLIYIAVNTVRTYYTSSHTADAFFKTNFVKLFAQFTPWNIARDFSNSIQGLIPEEYGVSSDVAQYLAGSILGKTLIGLIISGAVLFSIIKLLIQLIIAYINIIIQVIFAPIMLLFNALPQANTFTSWITNLIANAAAFPATAIMILIGDALVQDTGTEATFIPPMLNFFDEPTAFVKNVIGLGLILLMPKIIQIIQEALKAKPAVPAGAAVVEGITAAAGLAAAPFKYRREALVRRREAQYQAQEIGAQIQAPGTKGGYSTP